ncbi:MAG: cytochrome d ubiquinol oxidase subunit II [Gammaproteobacteria bacterium]|nr:cytochrome d ubiquinol oxidase subunit II [Gammaproteobacteria bacterium]
MILSYHILRVIWWILLGVLLSGFAIMDGFDLGIGILLPWVSRTDNERRIVINSIGPVWEGNQIWLILGGGAIFAAWPLIYAVSFSGFYFAMLLILLALILRPVGFKYRGKMPGIAWRNLWDGCLFFSGLVPTLLFGVAMGNVLQGVPFHFDPQLRLFYTGTLFDLLNPFGLLCGLVSVCMLVFHGGIFLLNKTDGPIAKRTRYFTFISGLLFVLLFAFAGAWLAKLPGYTVTSPLYVDGPSNPLYKTVVTQVGAWLHNYETYPLLLIVPALSFIGVLLAMLTTAIKAYRSAWLFSALMVASTVATVGISMFPFILPSSTHPDMSLLVFDASSSHLTLGIMLIATLIFMPIILLYTAWVYHVLRGKVTETQLRTDKQMY